MNISDIKEIDFFLNTTEKAVLSAYEHSLNVPFPIELVFVVNASQSCDRGAHAHKKCHQILVCIKGKIHLLLDDSESKTSLLLDNPAKGIHVPPGIWMEQNYEEGSILLALASQKYSEDEYIRNYAAFKKFREGL